MVKSRQDLERQIFNLKGKVKHMKGEIKRLRYPQTQAALEAFIHAIKRDYFKGEPRVSVGMYDALVTLLNELKGTNND